MKRTVEWENLRDLYTALFPKLDKRIEDYEIEKRSEFTQAILKNIFQDINKKEQTGPDKYTKLRIMAQWNPPQVVEVEPPPEDEGKRKDREVEVDPL